jgi:3-oxoacyl-[acyl-carrier-protein] synthase-3
MTSKRAGIVGLGIYLPERILTNFDLEKMVETSDEWIRTRTGVRERRIAEQGESSSDLGSRAALAAIQDAKLTPKDIELIIVATITPDMFFPSTACMIQQKIGAQCPAFDIAAACSGFPYALAVAEGFVRSGTYRRVLVVGAEVLSGFIDWKDRSTCVLFGDGAGAVVVSEARDGHGIWATYLGADGTQGDLLKIPGGGSRIPPSEESVRSGLHYLKMQGSEIFKLAVRRMEEAIREALHRGGLKPEDVDCLIPHQANLRILQAVGERVNIPLERIFVNVERYGNMSSASTAIALYEAVKQGKIREGSNVVLVAFGGGITWASCLVKW